MLDVTDLETLPEASICTEPSAAGSTQEIEDTHVVVPTGYGYVLPDQNGWSRYLHFQAAWTVVLTGLVYRVVLIG